jgi:MFS family permease
VTFNVAPDSARRRSFAALAIPNFRRYFFGQVISTSGTWIQIVAQSWLVLKLTGSGTALGLVNALTCVPTLLFGPWGGLIADRLPKRAVLLVTQASLGGIALVLGLLVATNRIELWMIYLLSWLTGCCTAIDMPTRQVFVAEIVGSDNIANAVGLNTITMNVARIVGPSIAGIVISTLGLGPCFILNGMSYAACFVCFALIDPRQLHAPEPVARESGQLREGLAYVRRTHELLVPLLLMAVIGTLAFEMQVILPLIARFTFDGDAGTYSLMTIFMGAGAVVTGMAVASRRMRSPAALGKAAIAYGLTMCLAAAAPNLATELIALVFVGASSITFLTLGNATLQLAAEPAMRGRVMALWSVAFVGSTPIGGPIVGWIGEHAGARWGLALGGVASVIAGLLAYRELGTIERLTATAPDPEPDLVVDPAAESLAEGA